MCILAVFCQLRIDLVRLLLAVCDELIDLALGLLTIELCILLCLLAGAWKVRLDLVRRLCCVGYSIMLLADTPQP